MFFFKNGLSVNGMQVVPPLLLKMSCYKVGDTSKSCSRRLNNPICRPRVVHLHEVDRSMDCLIVSLKIYSPQARHIITELKVVLYVLNNAKLFLER